VDPGTILKVIHAVLGVWIVAALVGRWVTLRQAASATDIAAVHTLLGLSDRFEWMAMRIPPLVLVLGVATAIVQGRPFVGRSRARPSTGCSSRS
jgi:mannose/fructose/N-acetylgalactosamine-specific phosphotransferase system component IID